MTPFLRPGAFALTLLLAATTAHAEQKVFGLNRAQVSDLLNCSGESTLSLAAYLMYSSKKPYAEALASALKANQDSETKLPAADIERRLKAVYAAKPPNSAAWAQTVFSQCVVARAIPVTRERIDSCYTTSFFLSMMVDLRKNGGDSRERIAADMSGGVTDAQQKKNLLALVDYYYDRPATSQDTQIVEDMRHFLVCASPDQRPVSGEK